MDKKRVLWGDLETHFMINIIKEKSILDMLDGKRYRNADIFKIIEEELKKRGFLKSPLQIRTKWKSLKLQYYKTKRANAVSGNNRIECPYYEQLDDLLGHRPAVNVDGVDTSATPNVDEGAIEAEVEPEDIIEEVTAAETVAGAPANMVEPTAGPSRTITQEQELSGPVKKKRKLEKKGAYNEALKNFSREFKVNQKEIATSFLKEQSEIIAKEMATQREWEERVLQEDRRATEHMLNNMMAVFFENLRSHSHFNPQPPAAPTPYPSPLSPTQFHFSPFQVPQNSICSGQPYPSPSQPSPNPSVVSPPFPSPSQPSPNPSVVTPPYPSPSLSEHNYSRSQPQPDSAIPSTIIPKLFFCNRYNKTK